MITFASLCPHPPLIIPAIGQNNTENLATTIDSLGELNDKLLKIKPDTIVIISPHHDQPNSNFAINNRPKYLGSLENFGDLSTKLELTTDIELISDIQKSLDQSKEKFTLEMIDEEKIDYSVTVPLYYLTQKLIGTKFVIINSAVNANLSAHLAFGKFLQKNFRATDKKIALIASGDLSHKISNDSPAGVSPRAKELDHTLIRLLKHKKINEIVALDEDLLKEAEECGLKPIALLLGMLYRVPYTPKILSYEHPFGIGYLTMEMELKQQ